jgi:hypothetical protein
MSVSSKLVRCVAVAFAFGLAFSTSALAQGGLPPGKGAPKGPLPAVEPPSPKKATHTRVFTPKHTDPAEVLQAIDMLLEGVANLEPVLDSPAPPGIPGVGPGFTPGGPGKPFGPGAPGGPGGPGPVPGGFPGAGLLGGIGLGGMMGGVAGPPHAARLAMDKRTGSIIVRGPEKELQIASDLFKLLDNPPDKPLPEFKSLRAFPLKFTRASNVANLAGELEFGVAVLALDEAKLLVAVGPPDAIRELAELVTALDAPVEKGPDTEKRKKLFSSDKEDAKLAR